MLSPGQQTEQSSERGGSDTSCWCALRHRFDIEDRVALGTVHVLEADLADEMLPVVCGVGAVGELDVVRINLLGTN
jgi:hypothetical protein